MDNKKVERVLKKRTKNGKVSKNNAEQTKTMNWIYPDLSLIFCGQKWTAIINNLKSFYLFVDRILRKVDEPFRSL